jgi:hypothetical protein
MSPSQYQSALQQAAMEDNSLEGDLLKQADGNWTKGGEAVPTGRDGIRLAVAVPLAEHGCVRWADGKIVERRLTRYVVEAPPRKAQGVDPYPSGFNPYTRALCVGMDKIYLGELMTYAGSSWGARFAFGRLLKPYARRGERYLPIVILGTKARHDANGNIDPVFTIVDWAPLGNFPDLLGEDGPALPAPKPAATVTYLDRTKASEPPPITDDPNADLEPLDDY